MPAPTTPLTGDPLLLAVTDAMVALHISHHHVGPESVPEPDCAGD